MPATLELVDTADDLDNTKSPLVLIHDGGGTTFSYYLLEPLDRTIYAIPYSRFDSNEQPPKDITELAQEYAASIRTTIGKGSIILGGWSFGGVVSLEVARLLANEPQITVTGLIMIDSSCPWYTDDRQHARTQYSFSDATSTETRAKVQRSYEHAGKLMATWEQPAQFKSPPLILIRAIDSTLAIQGNFESDDAAHLLGWSAFRSLNLHSILDVPGDHFSIFAAENVEALSSAVQQACDSLD